MNVDFVPTRAAGLARLAAFAPKTGLAYAAARNYDRPESTARLSPYIRHRMVDEREAVIAALNAHGPNAAEKFLQEVFWRSYWKGWLELRPGVWQNYRVEVQAALNRVQTEAGLRVDFHAACRGETGIDCFDHWARELADTGYLHNHARMWFASIWIFTLRLPWALGADLFLRSLIDGDAASNTLSWRWVAGLQTPGKHYVATAENIAKFTDGRFNPVGQLIENATSLRGLDHPDQTALPAPDTVVPTLRTGILIHDEDTSLEGLGVLDPLPTATLNATTARSPLVPARNVRAFAAGALDDAAERLNATARSTHSAQDIAAWAASHQLEQIILPYAPVGPVGEILADLRRDTDLRLAQIRKEWDSLCWPHATHGFFRFKKQIPGLIDRLITR